MRALGTITATRRATRTACRRARRTLDAALRPPDQDVQPRREPEAVAAAPLDDRRHPRLLLLAAHPERHEEDAARGQAVRRLDLQDLIDVALRRHDEFEPSVTVPKGGDRVGAQPHLRRDPGVSELQGHIPLVNRRAARELRAGRLDLDAPCCPSFAKISANSVDRAANARVTRQGNARRRWTVESEEGNQILGHTDLRRHPSTTERGEGTGQRADGRTGSGVTNRLGWIRPPVGRSDGAGDRLRGWE